MKRDLAADWADIQQVFRFAHDEREDYLYKLKARYGTGVASTVYATRAEQRRLDVLNGREERAYGRIFRWLDAHSPWDWHSGTSAHWICTELAAGEALSVEAPIIPARAAGYGSPRVEHRPERRRRALDQAQAI